MLLDTLFIKIKTNKASDYISDDEEEELADLASDLIADTRIFIQDLLRNEPEYKKLFEQCFIHFE